MEDEYKITKREWIRLWFKGTYDQILQLLGIRLPDHWLLLQAIEKKYGSEEAKAVWATAIILELDCGKRNNKKTIQRIRAKVKEGMKKE